MAKKDKNSMELPEVKDIPGQEHVRPPRLGEMGDATASSADEEGDDILGDENDQLTGPGSNVTPGERRALADTDELEPGTEDDALYDASMDDTDADGDPLNEEGFGDDFSGEDLDVPGAAQDDDEEEIGEEDEENNDYSISDNSDQYEPEED